MKKKAMKILIKNFYSLTNRQKCEPIPGVASNDGKEEKNDPRSSAPERMTIALQEDRRHPAPIQPAFDRLYSLQPIE